MSAEVSPTSGGAVTRATAAVLAGPVCAPGAPLHRAASEPGLSRRELVGANRPRICLPSARLFGRRAYQCGFLEAQDVLAECDDVQLIHLEAQSGFESKLRWLRRLMYHDVSRRLAFVNPGLKPVRLTRDYDLLVVMCATYWDFLYVNALEGWRDHCRTSVCWIDELWAADLPRYRHWLPSLKRFDHVFVGLHGTVAALSDAIERECHYMPSAVDTLRFSPYPAPPDRVIDVYSVGRRVETLHQALLRLASRDGLFYVHDTLHAGDSRTLDYREHREMYAGLAKRSRFFTVAPAKVDRPEETAGQVEVGLRYYEGLAAGAVMLGQLPKRPAIRELFDWPDAVVPVNPDGSDVADVLRELAATPSHMQSISRRNATQALLRHDWVYRWRRVLDIAGVRPSPHLEARERALNVLAAHAGSAVNPVSHRAEAP